MNLCLKRFLLLLTVPFLSMSVFYDAFGQPVPTKTGPAPPTNVEAVDTPNDDGSSITIRWKRSADDGGGKNNVTEYIILRKAESDAEFKPLKGGSVAVSEFKGSNSMEFEDSDSMKGSPLYFYIVRAVDVEGNSVDSAVAGPVKATGEWFHTGKVWMLIAVILFSGILVYCIYLSKAGQKMYIRRIAGLEAVDEAIGRATEMGRSILYVLGLGGVSDIATIAGMNILGLVARRTAEYETPLRVPCYDAIVMNVVREIAKTSYLNAGRPDAYSEENIFFVTDSQFAYSAAVDGMMMRERPAAIFLQGYFYAESLILAETGNSIGAIQIAGTTADAQLPFFITACDYTLIGEELFAASAYLSEDPLLLGNIKGQDICKLLLLGTLTLGFLLELFGVHWFTAFFQSP
jgi:hypothetical protein